MKQSRDFMMKEPGTRPASDRQSSRAGLQQRNINSSPAKIIDDCEECIQKELGPVYMGQSCLLVNERLTEQGFDNKPADSLS